MVRKFSRRARQYILAYFYIEHEMKENVEEGLHEINIERIKKEFKTHRSAIDLMKSSSTIASKNVTSSSNQQAAASSSKHERRSLKIIN